MPRMVDDARARCTVAAVKFGQAVSGRHGAAGARDVRLGGGVATLRQYLRAGLIDELHLALRPVLLGAGEALLAGLDLRALGYRCVESVAGERALHVRLSRDATD